MFQIVDSNNRKTSGTKRLTLTHVFRFIFELILEGVVNINVKIQCLSLNCHFVFQLIVEVIKMFANNCTQNKILFSVKDQISFNWERRGSLISINYVLLVRELSLVGISIITIIKSTSFLLKNPIIFFAKIPKS